MQRLDRYVASCFLSSYAVCALFFVGLFVLIDLFAKADDVFEHAAAVAAAGRSVVPLLARFYALLIPFIFLQVAPFVTVMAAMFAITRLRRTNELVPMIVAGRSVYRVLLPMFAFALLFGAGMVLVQEHVAPGLADARERVKALLFDGEQRRLVTGSYKIGGAFVTVRDYDVDAKRAAHFDVSFIDTPEPRPPLIGRDARWDEARGRFVYEEPDGAGGTVLREVPVALTPDVVTSRERGPYDLSYTQAQFLHERTGEDKWKVLLHYHLTFPLSNVLLLLLGLPFVLRHESRSLLLGMVVAILICGAYFAFDAVMRNLGEKDALHPVLAAWSGTIVFGSLGIVLLDGVRT